MDELFARQAALFRRLVDDYREGALDLNALIQRIEGIDDVLGMDAWKDAVFPIVLTMEQVNAEGVRWFLPTGLAATLGGSKSSCGCSR